jgi:hypothetical protein
MSTSPRDVPRDLDAVEAAFVRRFGKSGSNHRLEVQGKDFVLLDRRFQRPDSATCTRILELLGLSGSFTGASFDLVMTPEPVEPITVHTVERHIDEIVLIEMKTTAKPIRDKSLSGFFYGSTETQYELSRLAGDRLRWAFVVLNSDNVYGRPFFTLLTFRQVLAKTRSKRVQFQVNFETAGMPEPSSEEGPYPDPRFVDREWLAEEEPEGT